MFELWVVVRRDGVVEDGAAILDGVDGSDGGGLGYSKYLFTVKAASSPYAPVTSGSGPYRTVRPLARHVYSTTVP